MTASVVQQQTRIIIMIVIAVDLQLNPDFTNAKFGQVFFVNVLRRA